jgi:hypothetical protein
MSYYYLLIALFCIHFDFSISNGCTSMDQQFEFEFESLKLLKRFARNLILMIILKLAKQILFLFESIQYNIYFT